MIFNILIGTTVFLLYLEQSTNTAVSASNFPSDNHSAMRFYDNNYFKRNSSSRRNKKDNLFQHRHKNIQYAPLILNPIDELSSYTKMTELEENPPDSNKNSIEPQFNEQYYNINNENRKTTTLQDFGGHNIKKIHENELKPEYGNDNYDNSDRNTHIRSNKQQSDSNAAFYEKRLMTPFSSNSPDSNFNAPRRSIKHILQGLPVSENAKMHLILNPFYVRIPQIHVNNAHGRPIAHGLNKAFENGNIKRIHLKNYKDKFVPDIDVLLERKRFLYPSKNF